MKKDHFIQHFSKIEAKKLKKNGQLLSQPYTISELKLVCAEKSRRGLFPAKLPFREKSRKGKKQRFTNFPPMS